MTQLKMPDARNFGWALKPTSSSHFDIQTRPNGQFAVVLNHALLRGCRAEMVHWWFRNFANLKIMLEDVPGYEGKQVPAYHLWHPIDHYAASFGGELGPNGEARAGATIHIQEAMQYDRYGWAYPVDTKLRIYYVGPDGWAMGKAPPLLGPVMMLRIHFRDVEAEDGLVGVHYHYEVVIGTTAKNPLARAFNRRLTREFGPEFFAAWHRHNVIEVGAFENFLPPLYDQRADLENMRYSCDMDPVASAPGAQEGFSRDLFESRVAGYSTADNLYVFQQFARPSFI
ncbi:MAG: hypothetical protein AAGH83_00975 [Pseudomonadota bacterium]